MQSRLLLAEDERGLVVALRDRFVREGYAVDVESDGAQALQRGADPAYDVIVLDLALPTVDGLEICRSLRRQGVETPILMLTARAQIDDRVTGLRVGADDYLTKPFAFVELMARIEALLRRRPRLYEDKPDTLRLGDVSVDLRTGGVSREGGTLMLSSKELQLLHHFLSHAGQTLSRDQLLSDVWGYKAAQNTRTVDVHVAWLRRKIEIDPRNPLHIRTAHGVGYKFEL